MGMRNFAWISVSRSIGVSPAKVVIEVSRIGRKRAAPASQAAS
jgi:hypothetical protein